MKFQISIHLILTNCQQRQRHKIIIFLIHYNVNIYEKGTQCSSYMRASTVG